MGSYVAVELDGAVFDYTYKTMTTSVSRAPIERYTNLRSDVAAGEIINQDEDELMPDESLGTAIITVTTEFTKDIEDLAHETNDKLDS